MKIAVVYGTNRKKAMVSVVEWLREAFEEKGHKVYAGKPVKFDSVDYDLLVIGGSVYKGRVVDEILEFVDTNSEDLNDKTIATFVVCKEVETPDKHMAQILRLMDAEPITQMFIEGYMFWRRNFDRQESKAKDWTEEILRKLE